MNFQDIDAVRYALMGTLQKAMNQALTEAKKIAVDYTLRELYGSYEPVQYQRTYALLDALWIKSSWSGDTVTGELYIKNGKHPRSNWNERPYKTLQGVFDYFASGQGYKRGGSIDPIKDAFATVEGTRMLLDKVIQVVREKGFDVV